MFFCFFLPDGLGVNVDRGNALQKKFDHLQEWVGGLFGKRQLPSNLSLHRGETELINIHELINCTSHSAIQYILN